MIGLLQRVLVGAVCVSVVACDSASDPTPPSAPVTPTLQSLALSGTRPMVGTTSQFSLAATYSDGQVRDVTAEATWQSSDPGVATIQTPGSVQGAKLGYVEVSASYHGLTRREPMFVTSSGSYLVMKSDSGDEVGNGNSFAASNIEGGLYLGGSLDVLDKLGPSTSLVMRSANPQALVLSAYSAIFLAPGTEHLLITQPRLRVTLQSRNCSISDQARGTFEIFELESRPLGGDSRRPVTRLRATFEQFCRGS